MGVTRAAALPENNLDFMDILPISSLTNTVCPPGHLVKLKETLSLAFSLFFIPIQNHPAYPDSKSIFYNQGVPL